MQEVRRRESSYLHLAEAVGSLEADEVHGKKLVHGGHGQRAPVPTAGQHSSHKAAGGLQEVVDNLGEALGGHQA